MARIMAIDYGRKRIGLAVTDPLGLIATPLITVASKDIIQFLKDYFLKEEVKEIVIGMPKTLKNEDSENAAFVKRFIIAFQKTFPDRKIVTVDERFTTSIAIDTLIRGGMKKKDRQMKGNIDKVSATLILQSYLETKSRKEST